MRRILRNFVICFIGLLLFALFAKAQDESPSLGDVARKTRQQKQETKDTQDKSKTPAKAPRVITDEQVAHSTTDSNTTASAPDAENNSGSTPSGAETSAKVPAEQWKSRILAQKNAVSTLQSNIDKENESIQFAPANCVSGCVQWNEQQKKKQADVERMQAELKEQQKRLDEMQESARQQGYGSSVSDPE
jgi:hypothetical protein